MTDTFGDQMGAGSGKRPAPTIEGTATEVSVEPVEDEAVSADPAVEAETHGSEEATSEPKRKGPPPRTSPAELKSFFTHLAAGLLGGLIGVVGAAVAWNMLPFQPAKAPDLTPLENRLAKLESAPAPEPAGDNAEKLDALDARIKAVEERKVETPQDLTDLTSRVTRLEESMNALMPVAVERTSQRRCSIARNVARARWIGGSCGPYQESLVMFTIACGRVPCSSIGPMSERMKPGRMSS